MECYSRNVEWSTDEFMVKFQHFLDALTVMAYIMVPLELFYFIRISPVFPHKLLFFYCGNFAILCGSTYMTNWCGFSWCPETTSFLIIVVQACATVLSWLTVLIMFFVMPNLLCLKKSVHLLKNRVEELSREKSLLLSEVATRMSIVRLIDVIRSTIDGSCIAKSTVVGLGQIFDLEECSLWLPSETNKTLHLCQTYSHLNSVHSVVPMSLPVVAKIFNNAGAVRIPHTCPLVRESKYAKKCTPEVVAIRVPLGQYSFAKSDDLLDECAMSYAALVLVLPSDNFRKFRDFELELLGAVAQQVSVALDHASAVEESTMACDLFKKQNSSMEVTLRDTKIALRASEDSKVGIFYHVQLPLQAVTIVSSLLLETTLTPQQRRMTETLLMSSTYLETLMQYERRVSAFQDGMLEFNPRVFNLSVALKQAADIINPAVGLKRLSRSLVLSSDLPVYAVGDQSRLMQVILNVLSNAVKFTKEGHISIKASVDKPKTYKAWRTSKFYLVPSEFHFYLRVQIEDSGCGIDPEELTYLFHTANISNQHPGGKLGLAICKRLLEGMEGCIWVESDGLGKGTTATIIVKLGFAETDDF